MLEKVVSQDLLMPPSIRNVPRIIYLLFVDDLLVFSEGNFQSATCIKQTLLEFFSFLGLEAKSMKSFIFFSQVCEFNNEIISIFGYHVGELYTHYLGLPFELTLMCNVFALDKIRAKFRGWMCNVFALELTLMLGTFNSYSS